MSTMTLIEDYVDALLDGSHLDALPFAGDRHHDTAEDFAARGFQDAVEVGLAAGIALETGLAAGIALATGLAAGITLETGLAADTVVMPPAAANPMSQPAFDPIAEMPPAAPAVAVPGFVPAFVPSSAAVTRPLPSAQAPAPHGPAPHGPAPHAPAPQDVPVSALATSHRWLRVTVGRDSYALELLRVQEVVRLAPIVALRGAARAVLGVMNLRGRIVPVVDLGQWLGAGCVHGDDRSRIVVVERDDEMIGVLVSTVEDVVTLGRERIEPPLASSDPGAIVGIARVGVAPTVLLDANALFG